MVNEQPPGQCEVVKCVLVGDSGTGKTCLTCAWACDAKYDLQQLVKTHVASVWAIDHYRNDKEVLDKSWFEVDSARVSLRIWDTFGYHDKDRRFAYRGADVIIVCFSTAWPNSLRNVKKVWYPEIRRFCPTTPIILAGAQCDLRYLYHDEMFLKLEKGLMYKNISDKDIITPETGREVAKDIGAPYYETSVLTQHGVHDLFINSARAALIERRKIKFWSTPLRRVQRPLIQAPMKLPVPPLIEVIVPSPTLNSDLSTLLFSEAEADCVLRVKDTCFPAHRIFLMVAIDLFENLFTSDAQHSISQHHSSRPQQQPQRKTVAVVEPALHSDKDRLLDSDQDSVCTDITDPCGPTSTSSFSHPAVVGVEHCLREGAGNLGHRMQTVITLSPEISVQGLRGVLEFAYTGTLSSVELRSLVEEVGTAASALAMMDLLMLTTNVLSGEAFLNLRLFEEVAERRRRKITELALEKELLTDITFQVDDGRVSAHKALLMARCEMMFAMFSSDFLESWADVIPYPGLSKETFKVLQAYLYTGELASVSRGADVLDLIEVANRLCLPRLVALTEAYVVSELQRLDSEGADVLEDALLILEQAQLHNALQLFYWCRLFLSNHFHEVTQKYAKMFRSLQKENQEFIEKHRWPPIWYLREVEYYERHVHDTKHPEQRQQQDFNRWTSCSSSCLCFCRRGRMRMDDPVELPI